MLIRRVGLNLSSRYQVRLNVGTADISQVNFLASAFRAVITILPLSVFEFPMQSLRSVAENPMMSVY